MHLTYHRNWGLEYLFIRPEQWWREHETHFWLQRYELLDLSDAKYVLERVAREDPRFLRDLAKDTLPSWLGHHRPSSTYEEVLRDKELLKHLKDALGTTLSKRGEPPRFARFFVCRRKREAFAEPDDPWKEAREQMRKALRAAEEAPRGFVAVEVVNEEGAPVSGVRIELLLADSEVRTLYTDLYGRARAEPIPQGECHIRLPELDGSSWRPASGSMSEPVDQGRRRRHVVRQGESLARIAHQYGIRNWRKVWNAPENEALRKKRKNPNVLLPGDEVVVPGLAVHEIVRATDQTHRIVIGKRNPVVAIVNVHLLDGVASVGAEWSQGEITLSAAIVAYSDSTGVVLQMSAVPDQARLALVPPPAGATEAAASTHSA